MLASVIIMTNEKRAMERIGLFSEPGYTTISDPYGKKETVFRGKPPQDKGLKPLQIPGSHYSCQEDIWGC